MRLTRRVGATLSRAVAVAALALVLAAPAGAQQQMPPGFAMDGSKPIQIESDKLEVHEKEQTAIFSGNVSVVQGDMQLRTVRMTVHYAKGDGQSTAMGASQIERMEAEGKVYIKGNGQVATGDRADFDMMGQVIVLSGKEVVLTQGENVVVGCKLRIEITTGLSQLTGCEKKDDTGGRVKMLLQPQSAPQGN